MRTMRRRERRFRLAATYGAARNRPYDAACCGRNDTASAEIKTWLISVSDAAYRMWILRGYIRRVWLQRCRTALMSTNAAWTRLNGLQAGHANFKVCEYVMYIQWRNFWHCLHSMRNRVYVTGVRPSVRSSVCLSHHSTAAAACGGFDAKRRVGKTYRSTAAGAGAQAQQQRRRSTAFGSKCGQCHVDSRVHEAEHRLVFIG